MLILMLGNNFTFANDMPTMLAELTGAEVVHHTQHTLYGLVLKELTSGFIFPE